MQLWLQPLLSHKTMSIIGGKIYCKHFLLWIERKICLCNLAFSHMCSFLFYVEKNSRKTEQKLIINCLYQMFCKVLLSLTLYGFLNELVPSCYNLYALTDQQLFVSIVGNKKTTQTAKTADLAQNFLYLPSVDSQPSYFPLESPAHGLRKATQRCAGNVWGEESNNPHFLFRVDFLVYWLCVFRLKEDTQLMPVKFWPQPIYTYANLREPLRAL